MQSIVIKYLDGLLKLFVYYSVHLRQEEKLIVRMGRDGGVQQLELLGLVTLHIGDEKYGRVRVQLDNQDIRGVQLQTHPNVDKELFKLRSQVCCFLFCVMFKCK